MKAVIAMSQWFDSEDRKPVLQDLKPFESSAEIGDALSLTNTEQHDGSMPVLDFGTHPLFITMALTCSYGLPIRK